ncbi:MAG: hypothetical protein K2O27_02885 [Candidatus Amulumruptor sp.]|nr:hypothetical protein [Candidatus Amulumruptor sp.]
MMRKLLSVILILCPLIVLANDMEDKTHHRWGFNGALTSSDSWLVEFSYHYMFGRCIGLGGSAGSWKVYFEEGWASAKNWNIDEDDNKPSNFYIRPSILLKTPAWRYRACAWSLFAEPGVMMNVPYQSVCIESTQHRPAIEYDYISTNKGQWLALDVRLGVSLDIGPCGISAGYLMSNHDVYSQYRHLSYNGISFKEFYPEKPFMQGVYISLSYNL